MKTRLYFVMAVVMAVLSGGCDVHQFPDEIPETPCREILEIELDFKTDMPLYTVVTYPDNIAPPVASRSSLEAGNYEMRHTVNIYKTDDVASRDFVSRSEPVMSRVFFTPGVAGEADCRFELEIPRGEYSIMIWSDYVRRDDHSAVFYDTSDFGGVAIADLQTYAGSTEWRDSYIGESEVKVSGESRSDCGVRRTVTVAMSRPLAKLSVIATDVRKFAAKAIAEMEEDSRSNFDISGYAARLIYTGYLPSKFNMFADKPVDAVTGISFLSEIQQVDDDDACLAFDYVLVNGTEAKVEAAIQILDRDGKVISQSSAFKIPLMRGKLTEVRGKFLTASTHGGVGIIPEFDGEYNIYIP